MSLLDEDNIIKQSLEDVGIDTTEVQQTRYAEVVQEFVEEPEDTSNEDVCQENDNEITEAEIRIEKAALYKQFVSGVIFSGSGQIVEEVTKEFRDFARQQYLYLLGVKDRPIPVQDIFSKDEIQVLKTLAEKVLGNPKILQAKQPPQIKPAPPKLQLKPIEPKPPEETIKSIVRKPTLVTRKIEEAVIVPKLSSKPETKKTPAKPSSKPLEVPAHDAIVEEGGRKYRVHHLPMSDVDEYGIVNGHKVRKMIDGQTILLINRGVDNTGAMQENNVQVFKKNNSCFKIIKSPIIDREANKTIPGYIPFPSNDSFAMVSAQAATNAAAALGNRTIPCTGPRIPGMRSRMR
jgi:hypothetical protein